MLGFVEAGLPQARHSDPPSMPRDDTMWSASLSPEVIA